MTTNFEQPKFSEKDKENNYPGVYNNPLYKKSFLSAQSSKIGASVIKQDTNSNEGKSISGKNNNSHSDKKSRDNNGKTGEIVDKNVGLLSTPKGKKASFNISGFSLTGLNGLNGIGS